MDIFEGKKQEGYTYNQELKLLLPGLWRKHTVLDKDIITHTPKSVIELEEVRYRLMEVP